MLPDDRRFPSTNRPRAAPSVSILRGIRLLMLDARGPPEDHDPHRHPAERRTVRLWAFEGAGRGQIDALVAGATTLDRHVAPQATRQATRGLDPVGLARSVRVARRLGNRARQRRHDRVLGRCHVRARGASQPTPVVRRVLVQVRRGVQAAPHLDTPTVIESPPGDHPRPVAEPGVDLYALTHNETSTGVAMHLRAPRRCRRGLARRGRRHLRRGWSAMGRRARSTCTTSPPRSASRPTVACGWRPARRQRVERIERIAASGRWSPASIDLEIALENSRRPDLQHPGRRHPDHARRSDPSG